MAALFTGARGSLSWAGMYLTQSEEERITIFTAAGRAAVRREDLMDGIPALVPEIRLEAG